MRHLVPSCIPFPDRPFSFVSELQRARLAHLHESLNKKRRSRKDTIDKSPSQPRARKQKVSTEDLLTQMLLGELSKKGV